MSRKSAIVWFRNDLRVADNAALTAAIAAGGGVTGVFVLDEAAAGARTFGAASLWWLHHSLRALADSLEDLGIQLVLRRGCAEKELAEIQEDTGAEAVQAHRAYEPWARAQEERVEAALTKAEARLHLHAGHLLFEPDQVATQSGTSFRVFTPFWRAVSRREVPAPPGKPKAVADRAPRVRSDRLDDWALLPTTPDWAGGLRETWIPGEAGAVARLKAFLAEGLARYASARDRPDQSGTSRLSPHLRFGEISPARVWHAAHVSAVRKHGKADKGLDVFLRELAWREFSYHQLWHCEDLAQVPIREEFERIVWRRDKTGLEAWHNGRTGYPIVDAGMRELWGTGYMHNRVRMIVASFLIKDLLIDWRQGERWFWDTLVDADPANNPASWQWVAGCGADAAPYFRIFNPVRQGQEFDPEGRYVRRWVPELAKLPNDEIHAPWLAPDLILQSAGVELGATYPRPIVDHAEARKRALSAFAAIKG